MTGPSIADLWASSHVEQPPVYEWPDFVLYIIAAYREVAPAVVFEEAKSWPKPDHQITLTSLCGEVARRERLENAKPPSGPMLRYG